ncbi:MAG: hypothetical protein MH204_08000, partial [Fimbriimonadaceae bacterium]|nr:hypothetical protein [Fimbriimonadaceae bacterium]
MNVILPIAAPLFFAAAMTAFTRKEQVQRLGALLAAVIHLGVSANLFIQVWRYGAQTAFLGDWPAPYGIVLVADTFGATMNLVGSL